MSQHTTSPFILAMALSLSPTFSALADEAAPAEPVKVEASPTAPAEGEERRPAAVRQEEGESKGEPRPVDIKPTEGRPWINPIPRDRLYLASLNVLRYNPLGLETQNRLVFQHRLKDTPEVLYADTFVNAGLSLKLNPAYTRVGVVAEVQPIALFHLRAGYEYAKYFGGFDYLQSFPDPDVAYSDADLAANGEAGLNYVTGGGHLYLEPTVRVKVDKVLVQSKTVIERWNLSLTEGTYVFYDATLDTLVPNQALVVSNDSDLLYFASPKLIAGVRFSMINPIYPEELATAATTTDAGEEASTWDTHTNDHKRVGPMIAYSFHTRNYTGFNRPTLLANAGWYIDHPYRQGAIPYVLVAFSFSSDFMDKK